MVLSVIFLLNFVNRLSNTLLIKGQNCSVIILQILSVNFISTSGLGLPSKVDEPSVCRLLTVFSSLFLI